LKGVFISFRVAHSLHSVLAYCLLLCLLIDFK